MNIVVLGAGQVGSTVASHLAKENYNVTVVDRDAQLLQQIEAQYDIQPVAGHASHPDVLARAGVSAADILIAVTDSDETNIVACQVAYSLFHTPERIARVRAAAYHNYPDLFRDEAMPINHLISPEQLVTDHIRQLIIHPGALQVLKLSASNLRLVAVKARYGGALVGQPLSELKQHVRGGDVRVAAIYRRGRPIIPEGKTVIDEGDEIFLLTEKKNLRQVLNEMRPQNISAKRIMLAGGGRLGLRLAQSLKTSLQVKVVESNLARSRTIAEVLGPQALIIYGDATERSVLVEEQIEKMDIFCAITNDEEVNILSAMLAKRLGASKVMALINRPAYVELIKGSPIDIAISPQQATISDVLARVRGRDVITVHSLHFGVSEAIEVEVSPSSWVIGQSIKRIEENRLPSSTIIGAVIRDHQTYMDKSTIIRKYDHVIVFIINKKDLSTVVELFKG